MVIGLYIQRALLIGVVFLVGGLLEKSCLQARPLYADFVFDEKTGDVLHSTNSDEMVHPASLTKKMTLYLLFEALKSGRVHLHSRLKVSARAARQIPSRLNLKVGDSISVLEAIQALVIKSANDVAFVVAENLGGSFERFVARMNQRAKDLGMMKTFFVNPSGVPDKSQVTTARDMVQLARALYKKFPEYCFYFRMKGFYFRGNFVKTHNHLLNYVRGLDGIKTGFINDSGFNISTSVVRLGDDHKPRRIFVVVMGGPSYSQRDKRAHELIEYAYQKISNASTKEPEDPCWNAVIPQKNRQRFVSKERLVRSKTSPTLNRLKG